MSSASAIVVPKKKQLASELRALEAKHDELLDAVKRLAALAAALAVAVRALSVREAGAVPSAEIDAAVAGTKELSASFPPAAQIAPFGSPPAAAVGPDAARPFDEE